MPVSMLPARPAENLRRMGYLNRALGVGFKRRQPTPVPHGTLSGYNRHACRCGLCREANRAYKLTYQRDYRAKPKTWPRWAHGRQITYLSGCRCEGCRRAHADAKSDYLRRKKAAKRRMTPNTRGK